MAASLAMLAELGAMTDEAVERVLSRIRVVPEALAAQALAAADVVFECVTETLDAKRGALARICSLARPDAILASTTSTILVTDLVPLTTHPERLINAHWLNPAYLIPLVELSAHPGTAPEVISRLRASARGHRQGTGPVRRGARIHRAAPAGADHERGGAHDRRRGRERRGDRQGHALRARAALFRHRRDRVHRLRRQRVRLLGRWKIRPRFLPCSGRGVSTLPFSSTAYSSIAWMSSRERSPMDSRSRAAKAEYMRRF